MKQISNKECEKYQTDKRDIILAASRLPAAERRRIVFLKIVDICRRLIYYSC